MRLKDKVVWITGGGTGIGEATALTLAAEGARLILTGRRPDRLAAVAATVQGRGGTARVAPGDLTLEATAGAIVGTIAAQEGRLDIVVSNAGVNRPARSWERLTPEAVRALVDGNLTAAYLTSLAALSLMRPARRGHLIHIASIAGVFLTPQPGSVYSAAKRGVIAMSHTLNMEEAGRGIRSTAISPGDVATPLLEQRPEYVSPERRAAMLRPQDVADLILHVATLPPRVHIPEVTIVPRR